MRVKAQEAKEEQRASSNTVPRARPPLSSILPRSGGGRTKKSERNVTLDNRPGRGQVWAAGGRFGWDECIAVRVEILRKYRGKGSRLVVRYRSRGGLVRRALGTNDREGLERANVFGEIAGGARRRLPGFQNSWISGEVPGHRALALKRFAGAVVQNFENFSRRVRAVIVDRKKSEVGARKRRREGPAGVLARPSSPGQRAQ